LPVLVMAEIILINPRFDPTYWGLDYALPFFRKAALLPPLNLALLDLPSGYGIGSNDPLVLLAATTPSGWKRT